MDTHSNYSPHSTRKILRIFNQLFGKIVPFRWKKTFTLLYDYFQPLEVNHLICDRSLIILDLLLVNNYSYQAS